MQSCVSMLSIVEDLICKMIIEDKEAITIWCEEPLKPREADHKYEFSCFLAFLLMKVQSPEVRWWEDLSDSYQPKGERNYIIGQKPTIWPHCTI